MAAALPALKMALTVPATGGGAPLCGNRQLHAAAEYVIVKQHRHCEEYLDGNAKVFDVLPLQDGPSRKECELLLRRLTAGNGNNGTFTALPNALHRASSPSLNLNTQVSSLLSTDKDSGMGSPVGSSRSARLRRRKYKSAATVSWLAQANTLHPRVSQRAVAAFSGLGNALSNAPTSNGGDQHFAVSDCGMGEADDVTADALDGFGRGGDGGEGGGGSANERLLKIILAQDETIHRQLALLREKERQISKIEEEKHRVRERELGKNYLLETYLNGLDEAHGEPDLEACTDVALADSPLNEFNDVRVADAGLGDGAADDDGRDDAADVEIYIDEPFERTARTIGAAITTTAAKKDIGTSKAKDFSLDARHSKKLKGDFGGAGGGEAALTGGKFEANKQPAVSCQDNEKDVEAQLVWLEKIYALNKQLQREEELLLKLHAKIRKHQVKRAYQTKREVLQQIEKLDAELTLQCCDIRAVESKLHASNEQLKQKLGVLERLSQEFLQTMDTATATATATAGDVLLADAADAPVAAANRMPDVINNDDHIRATMLPGSEVARTRGSQVADVALHAQQTTDGLAALESCQLQQCGGTQDEAMDLPQTVRATAAHCNKIKELCELTQTNTTSMTTTTTQIQSAAEMAIATATTTAANALTLRHATTLASKLTATSCTTAPSALTSTAATTTTTATHAASTAEAAAFACNMPAMSPADEKQTTALRLLQPQHLQQQRQQQQQQQKQLSAAAEDGNNSHQRVAADDVLVDALAADGGAALPQSNYPISCINQAAIHATSKQATQHVAVAAANFTAPEQALPTATAILPAAYVTSAAAQSAGNAAIRQQQKQQAQLPPQRQYLSYMSAGCVSSNSNNISCNNNASNKNLLPPSHVAHTKTLQKQMFGPKSLNQPPPPKTIHTSAAAWTTPPAPTATPKHAAARTGCSMPSISATPCPTTPTTLSASPVVPPVVDITQLGTLV